MIILSALTPLPIPDAFHYRTPHRHGKGTSGDSYAAVIPIHFSAFFICKAAVLYTWRETGVHALNRLSEK
jgi:hypothetical protein